MKKNIAVISLASLAVLGAAFLFPSTSHAQVGISLFPIKFDVTVAPGQTYSDTVTVINPNDFPIGVQPEVENIAGGNQGSIDLTDTDIPHGLSAWISLNMSEFTLAPQEQLQVPFTITVPANGEPGGHYGAILFRGLSATSTASSSGVGISGRVGTVILLNVPGDSYATGDIASFAGPASYVSHGPFNFSFTVNNTGNTHFTPQGQITLSGPLFGSTAIPFTPGIVFPGYDRTFTASWPGRYAFGPMTATLSLTIPDDTSTITQTITFFAFPWQETLVIVVVLIVLYIIFRTWRKNFKIVRVK
ncbi:MAG TPA: DUF916 domain-containing protein [Candidatus Paceibacterota bacterium]|nr:DUF916 domain-containing protein [Candidatus Paceibacterota bacterium]